MGNLLQDVRFGHDASSTVCAFYVHVNRNGSAHCDLKPGNIMLTKTGAWLLDFGLAKKDRSA